MVKRLVDKKVRVGHAGTLDSTASGLLMLLLGSATRLSDYAMKLPKVYEAVIRLGKVTDTCDASGKVIFQSDAASVDEAAFDRVLYSFLGTRMQRPPEISALKVNGKVSHKAAREGELLTPAARPVFISSVKRISPVTNSTVVISVFCGKGTYIRALARDIGEKLGCGAHVEELRRLSVGSFHVSDAYAFAESSDQNVIQTEILLSRLLSPLEIIHPFQRIVLTSDAEHRLRNGLSVPIREAGKYIPGMLDMTRGLFAEGKQMVSFVDIVERDDTIFLKPKSNIPIEGGCAG